MATLELTLAASCRRTRCSLQPPQLLSSPGIPPCSERCPCGRAPPAYEPTPCSAERREQRREESVRETGSGPQARLTTISHCQSGVLAWCAAGPVIHPIATLMHLKLLSGLCPCWCGNAKISCCVMFFFCLLVCCFCQRSKTHITDFTLEERAEADSHVFKDHFSVPNVYIDLHIDIITNINVKEREKAHLKKMIMFMVFKI